MHMHLPTLRLGSSLWTMMSRRLNSPPPLNPTTATTNTSTSSTSSTSSSTCTSTTPPSHKPSSASRDRSPSTSSTKSTFSASSVIYPISPPEAHLDLPWRMRRGGSDENEIEQQQRGRSRYLSFGDGEDGEAELLEPRPERMYVNGLWEAMMVEEGG